MSPNIYHKQDTCHEKGDELSHTAFYARDKKNGKSKGSKQYFSFPTISDYKKYELTLGATEKNHYEQIRPETHVVESYDIDGWYKYSTFQDADGNPLSTEVIVSNFCEAREDFQDEVMSVLYPESSFRRSDLFIKNSTKVGGDKASLHILVRNGMKFSTIKEHKTFTTLFIDYIKEGSYSVDLDTSIYSNNRCFRLLGHSKQGEDRPSYRYDENDISNYKNFYTTYTDGTEKLYDKGFALKEKIKVDAETLEILRPKTNDNIFTLVNMVFDQVRGGDSVLCDSEVHDCCNYDNWKNIIFTVFSCCNSYGVNDFLKRDMFNKLFPLYRNSKDLDSEDTFKNMNQYDYSDLTIRSLHYWAKDHPEYSVEFAEQIKEFQTALKFKIFDRKMSRCKKMSLTDNLPIKYIHEVPKLVKFSSYNDYTLKYIENLMSKIVCNVALGGRNLLFNLENRYDRDSDKYIEEHTQCKYSDLAKISGVCNIYVRLLNINYKKQLTAWLKLSEIQKMKQLEPKLYLSDILADTKSGILCDMFQGGKIDVYNKVTFAPYLLSTKEQVEKKIKNCLNLFTGFVYDDGMFTTTERWINSRMRDNLQKHLCAGNEEFFKYVEGYIAHMIQKPSDVHAVMLIFSGHQGTGKDIWVKFLANMMGNQYYLDIGKMGDLFKPFNSNQQKKLLVRINEISDKGNHIDNHDQLKHILAQTEIRIEPKGLDPFHHEHLARYIGFTQKDNVVVVEATDRRMCMIKTDNSKAQNLEYLGPAIKEINDPDTLRSAFYYYSTLDISAYEPRKIPQTTYRQDQKIVSLATPYKFLLTLFEMDMADVKLHTSEFYMKYLNWCCAEGYTKNCIKSTFATTLTNIGLIQHRISIDGARKQGFAVSWEELNELFKKHLRDETFLLTSCEM